MHGDFSTGQVSVGTTATQIFASKPGVDQVLIQNMGTASVFIGKAGVTAATGYPILAGDTVELPVTEAIFGIVATGTQTVAVLITA